MEDSVGFGTIREDLGGFGPWRAPGTPPEGPWDALGGPLEGPQGPPEVVRRDLQAAALREGRSATAGQHGPEAHFLYA